VDDSRTLPDITVNFVKSHSLMDDAVPALFSRPIFTRISLQSRLTSIAVDNQISGLKGQYYDILFLGTGKTTAVLFSLRSGFVRFRGAASSTSTKSPLRSLA